jgi:hypothetical protein
MRETRIARLEGSPETTDVSFSLKFRVDHTLVVLTYGITGSLRAAGWTNTARGVVSGSNFVSFHDLASSSRKTTMTL